MTFKKIQDWVPGLEGTQGPLIIAGPCSAEREEQVLGIARRLREIKGEVHLFRCGIWKPRTRPNSFEGVGERGLDWLRRVKEEWGFPCCVEVAKARHVELVLRQGVDVLWIGGRTTVSPFAVQEIADALKGVDIPVLVKNPLNEDLGLWIGALERLHRGGIEKLGAFHRGFPSYPPGRYRSEPKWHIPLELRQQYPTLPLLCDPSHIAGKRDLVGLVSQKALDLNFDGLMIESHHDPSRALSDPIQQLLPEDLEGLLKGLVIKTPRGVGRDFEPSLEGLRSRLDSIDAEILDTLARRAEVVGRIGAVKRQNAVQVLPMGSLNERLETLQERALSRGIPHKFLRELYALILDESIRIQTDLADSQGLLVEEGLGGLSDQDKG